MKNLLQLQRQAHLTKPSLLIKDRLRDLDSLRRFVVENKLELCEAVSADYGHRSHHETLLHEIYPIVDGIKHTCSHLKKWMQVQKRTVGLSNFGAKNRVLPQPLGVVGVIVPWNFPINLSFGPLISIFAAGNNAMVKMSEKSPRLAKLLMERIPQYFTAQKLIFIEDSGGIGEAFSQLPFDHLLFSGSAQTGRKVMAAAAQNLVPVTLELGGRSPAVVLADFPLKIAAERILLMKYLNAGQICVTVDHLWLQPSMVQPFVDLSKQIVVNRYGTLASVDYTSIIDKTSFERLIMVLEEARAAGATLISLLPGAAWDAESRKIAPHIVLNAPKNSALFSREIFGPILPIQTYAQIDEVVAAVNAGPHPLAFYPFSSDAKQVQSLIERVMSGGVSVNDAVFHVGQHDLPFGGVGASGMGQYHGREGFETFSKMRPIFYQARTSSLKRLSPPYGKYADWVLSKIVR